MFLFSTPMTMDIWSLVYITFDGVKETAVLLKDRYKDNVYTAKVIGEDGTESGDVQVDVDIVVKKDKRLYYVGAPVKWFQDPSDVYYGSVIGYCNDTDGKIAYMVTDGYRNGAVRRADVYLLY